MNNMQPPPPTDAETDEFRESLNGSLFKIKSSANQIKVKAPELGKNLPAVEKPIIQKSLETDPENSSLAPL